jgi:zinc resistance-associated protein
VKKMRNWLIGSTVVFTFVVLVSAVFAHSPGQGGGLYCKQLADADIDKVRQFQRETLPLRDEMMIKKLEVRKELNKETPDRGRIAELKKEMIDIRTQIQKRADGAGLPSCEKRFMKRAMDNRDGKGLRLQHMGL